MGNKLSTACWLLLIGFSFLYIGFSGHIDKVAYARRKATLNSVCCDCGAKFFSTDIEWIAGWITNGESEYRVQWECGCGQLSIMADIKIIPRRIDKDE